MNDKLKVETIYQFNNYKNNLIGNGVNRVKGFEVIWKELSYKVRHLLIKRKIIINNISGSFRSGQIMAIMGPSGCGKSSLLGCLSGSKKKGVSGSITISTERQVKFAFIAQDDYLEGRLTVKESLIYASTLKNIKDIDHKLNAENIMRKLDIEKCANIRTKRCSGGQKKRISIALELVSRPNILILDEPTSGLDSATTWQLINTLIQLTNESEPLAVVATIHQPSGKLFNLFNSIYIMSYDGHCVYHGSPLTMVDYLGQYGLKCPKFHNPSDYVLEIASKEHGIGKVMLLSTIMKIEALELIPHQNQIKPYLRYRTGSDLWALTKRTFKLSIRDIFMLPLRVGEQITVAVMLCLFWGEDSGELSGCPDNFVGEGGSYSDNYDRVWLEVNENFSLITFTLMNIWFGSIFAVLLTFPKEMNILIKEYRNGWYSCYSYYMSKVLVDVFWQITIPNLLSIPVYLGTGQYFEEGERWRFGYYIVICLLLSLTSSSTGLVVSAYLMNYPTAAAFLGTCTAFPMLLFSGFMIPIKDMPKGFQWFSCTNYMRFAVEATVTAIYGFGRCDGKAIEYKSNDLSQLIPQNKLKKILTSERLNGKLVVQTLGYLSGQTPNGTDSIIMINNEFEDNDLYYGIAMLCLIMTVYKVSTYYILLRKVNSIN